MRLKALLFPLVATLMLSACSDDGTPKAGQHYKELEQTVAVTPVAPVTEIFSLSCGHCRSMEAILPSLAAKAGTDIEQSHVTFNESAKFASLLFYSAAIQQNDSPDRELVEELFEYVQEQQSESAEENKRIISELFSKHGLTSPYDLDKDQQESLFAAIEKADVITREAGIQSVPTFLVKGKYLVELGAHGNEDELAKTLKYLLEI